MEILPEKLKYYQKSLGELAPTLSEDKKKLSKTADKTVLYSTFIFFWGLEVFRRFAKI